MSFLFFAITRPADFAELIEIVLDAEFFAFNQSLSSLRRFSGALRTVTG